MALVVLSKVEQRLDAVRAVLAGASVVEVAAAFGVSRVSVHAWLRRYLAEGLAGLVDRSHRPRSCPHQVSDSVAVLVAEVRRQHPRWGAKRIWMELLRKPPEGVVIPSTATVNRILVRHVWCCSGNGNGRGTPMSAGSGQRRCSCGRSTLSAE
jgi:transposase